MHTYLKFVFCSLLVLSACSKSEEDVPSPIASFDINQEWPYAPIIVYFSNTSQNASSYLWDLGGGDETTIANPNKMFFAPGNYTIRLTARNGEKSSEMVKNISVLPAPSKIKITRVDLITSNLLCSGQPCDSANGPDVYLNISKSGTTLYENLNQTFNNAVTSQIPLRWDLFPPVIMMNSSGNGGFYYIEARDNDSPSNYQTVAVGTFSFTPPLTSFPAYKDTYSIGGNVFRVYLAYE